MVKSNTCQFKQILIDVENYSALNDLRKTGDSFNNVIRDLLNKTKHHVQTSIREIYSNDVIEISLGYKSFILKTDSGLRKVGVNDITGFKDYLEIDFLDESGVNVDFPNDLLRILGEVESALLNSNMQLPNYTVKRIIGYFEEHVYKVEASIRELT